LNSSQLDNMKYFDKIKPETVIYGVAIIGLAWWLSGKISKASDTYNPFDADNKVNQAAKAGVFDDALTYSNPILAAVEAARNVAKAEYEYLKGVIFN